ncbi:MAG: preprotein translocase subunit SecG [Bacteroidota bacterium]|nr:preprotein translocase subunit SecG [Bacteroidota bacterium]
MLIIFGALIIICSIILGLIVLVQNPKGGGLSSSLGGFGNQLMGVKQTTDVLEKGTWLFAAIIGILCLTSAVFIPKTTGNLKDNQLMNAPVTSPSQQQNTAPFSSGSQTPAAPQK